MIFSSKELSCGAVRSLRVGNFDLLAIEFYRWGETAVRVGY